MLKTIVVVHSCPTAYVIKHFNRALNFFKNGQAIANFESLKLRDYSQHLLELFSECSCHGCLFKTANKCSTS